MKTFRANRHAIKWIRLHLINEHGYADALIRKSHLEEGIPKDEEGRRFLKDFNGDRVYFNNWRHPNPGPLVYFTPKKYKKHNLIPKCDVCSTIYSTSNKRIRGCPKCYKYQELYKSETNTSYEGN